MVEYAVEVIYEKGLKNPVEKYHELEAFAKGCGALTFLDDFSHFARFKFGDNKFGALSLIGKVVNSEGIERVALIPTQ